MNFLAHFHLCHEDEEAIIGSFLGDFIKGNDYRQLPVTVANAIVLHRRIDSFTDSHPVVIMSKARFSREHRRYAGIILDLFYDHFLVRHWERFSTQSLPPFCQRIYQHLVCQQHLAPQHGQQVIDHMSTYNWLGSYGELDSLRRALNGISRRLSRPAPLAGAVNLLEQNYAGFEQDFLNFYPLLCTYSQQEKEALRRDITTTYNSTPHPAKGSRHQK